MRLSFWILMLVGCAVTGCAAPDSVLDRGSFSGELAALSVLDDPAPAALPQDEKPAATEAPPAPQEERATDADRPEDHADATWTRRAEQAEIAIIKDQLQRDPSWKEKLRPRRTCVTLFGELVFAHDTAAVDTASDDDPDWNELVDGGYGVGLEMSYDLLPVVQPLVGFKFNVLKDDLHHFGGTGGDPFVRRESSELRTAPMYAGLRLNFPLDCPLEDWFDPDAAGRTVGVIPFLRAVGGAAWVCGQELTLADLTNNVTIDTDFIRRGWTGYFEGAVGIEYRVREGFAFELTVGFQQYVEMKLDRSFRHQFPTADSEPMTVFFLPRLGASFYF